MTISIATMSGSSASMRIVRADATKPTQPIAATKRTNASSRCFRSFISSLVQYQPAAGAVGGRERRRHFPGHGFPGDRVPGHALPGEAFSEEVIHCRAVPLVIVQGYALLLRARS